jgi:ATP-dependent DNA helicase RecG
MIDIAKLKSILKQGEGLNVEFKTSRDSLTRSVFESICAFLNRKGGHILLGVKDNGNVEGVREDTVQTQLKILADDMNNPQLISPTFYLAAEESEIDGKKVIYIFVPESSQVHTYRGIYYDRNQEGDYRLNSQHLIMNLYLRKYDGFTENRVFSHLTMNDFETELFDMVRNRVRLEDSEHPWQDMSNEDILRSAKLYQKNAHTGEEGYTLAAALLFGKESTIASVCGHHKIDALCRRYDLDRYDDRDVIHCNLLRAYTRLMSFIEKHTPDRFYLEGIQRRSIRNIIFREMVANFLVHREYSSHYPARMIVYKETVVTENWTIPQAVRRITPENVIPHPKNPVIANFFRQIGWVEDLGSGIRNMYKYCPIYVPGAQPVMEEDDVFRLTVRYEREGEYNNPHGDILKTVAQTTDIKYADEILALIRMNPKITATEMSEKLSIKLRNTRYILAEMKNKSIISRNGSDKNGEWEIMFQ